MKKELKKSIGPKDIASLSENALSEKILVMLKDPEGLYAIDHFSTGSGPFFYLRMRHKCYTFVGIDAMGECIALTEDGCTLTEDLFFTGSPVLHCKQAARAGV